MHIVKLLERRFPKRKAEVSAIMFLLSASILLVGLGLLFIQ